MRTVTKLRIRNSLARWLLPFLWSRRRFFTPSFVPATLAAKFIPWMRKEEQKNTTQLMAESTWSGNVFLAVSNPPSPPSIVAGRGSCIFQRCYFPRSVAAVAPFFWRRVPSRLLVTGASTGDPKVRDAALMSKNEERDSGGRVMSALLEERMLWSCCLRGTRGDAGSPFCPPGTYFSCTIHTSLF